MTPPSQSHPVEMALSLHSSLSNSVGLEWVYNCWTPAATIGINQHSDNFLTSVGKLMYAGLIAEKLGVPELLGMLGVGIMIRNVPQLNTYVGSNISQKFSAPIR